MSTEHIFAENLNVYVDSDICLNFACQLHVGEKTFHLSPSGADFPCCISCILSQEAVRGERGTLPTRTNTHVFRQLSLKIYRQIRRRDKKNTPLSFRSCCTSTLGDAPLPLRRLITCSCALCLQEILSLVYQLWPEPCRSTVNHRGPSARAFGAKIKQTKWRQK